MCADSEEEKVKKKMKTTPSKKGVVKAKGGKSPAPVVKKEIRNVTEFFGSTPVQRSFSSQRKTPRTTEKRKNEVNS